MKDLDAALLAAHRAHDIAGLVTLYHTAAMQTRDVDARAFYLTHAHIFALECGHPETEALRAALVDMGREHPL